MKLFTKKTKQTTRKIAYIRTTSKGYSVNYRAPRKIVHGGQF